MPEFSPSRFARAIAVVTLAGLAGTAAAQDTESTDPATQRANSSGWLVQCSNNAEDELRCSATMTVTANESDQAILSISLQEAPAETGPTLIIQLPFGLNLPRGIDLSIDEGEAMRFEVNTCLQTGCFVVQQADPLLIEAMAAGNTLSVLMEASNGGETRMNVTLKGFSNAMDRLN